MFGTLLDKLQSIFSKSLALGSIPLLLFLVLHGLMVFLISNRFRDTLNWYLNLNATKTAELTIVLFLGVAVVSLVLSTLSVFLREVIEGKHIPFGWIETSLSQKYRDRLAVVEGKLASIRRYRRRLRAFKEDSTQKLGGAYVIGQKQNVCVYQRRPGLTSMIALRSANQCIDLQALQSEVDAMIKSLQDNNPELSNDDSAALDADYVTLLTIIEYTFDGADAEYVRYFSEYRFDYAGQDVAPTKMGNIANIAPNYASSRYSMNLDLFWTRLQKVAQGDSTFYQSVQDAKMQLDFLISLIWQTFIFTVVWVIALPFTTRPTLFLIVAIAGPLALWIWYLIALQNYRSFSDLLRATIDLYRLDLLKTLRIAPPATAEQERSIWEMLERRLGYDDHSNFPLQNS